MRYGYYTNQRKAVEWGIGIKEAAVFAFLIDSINWFNEVELNGEKWSWVSKGLVAKEMPLLKLTPKSVYRMMSNLRDAGLIELCSDRRASKTLIRLTTKAWEWISSGDAPASEQPYPKMEKGVAQICTTPLPKNGDVLVHKDISTEVNTKNTMGISDEIPDADDDPKSNDLFGTEKSVDRKTCPWEAILDKWAEIMPDKQQPSKNMWQGTSRANDLAQRWRACFSIKHEATGKLLYTTTEEGIEWWGRFFSYMRKSDFLMGKTGNARWFKLDWIVKKSNFVKIMENHYHQ